VSEPEDFLTRWSRRKREAEQAPQSAEPTNEAREPVPPAVEPSVDLSALPPIDQITATTDIRAYLAPGVPAELARAALRRAWVADPTIREFIGIAENQWDFNDPHGVPGFGPIEDVGRLVSQLLGDEEPRAAPPASSAELRDTAPLAGPPAIVGDTAAAADDQPGSVSQCEANMSANESIAASQQADRARPASHAAVPRSHGGALPK
jgi:hypothetical protein